MIDPTRSLCLSRKNPNHRVTYVVTRSGTSFIIQRQMKDLHNKSPKTDSMQSVLTIYTKQETTGMSWREKLKLTFQKMLQNVLPLLMHIYILHRQLLQEKISQIRHGTSNNLCRHHGDISNCLHDRSSMRNTLDRNYSAQYYDFKPNYPRFVIFYNMIKTNKLKDRGLVMS